MNIGPASDQPMPTKSDPPLDPYTRLSEGCAAPRAAGMLKGTLSVAMPVVSCAEKLSPMPEIVAAPLGKEMDCAEISPAPFGRLAATVLTSANGAMDESLVVLACWPPALPAR